MSGLKKMQIVAYKDDKFTSKVSGGSYVVMLNPENITINRSVNYNEEQAPDSGKLSSKYRSTPGQTLSFDLIIDVSIYN